GASARSACRNRKWVGRGGRGGMSCRCPPLRPLGMPVNDARDRAARDAEAYCDLPIREAAPVKRDHPRYVRCLPLTGKVRLSGLITVADKRDAHGANICRDISTLPADRRLAADGTGGRKIASGFNQTLRSVRMGCRRDWGRRTSPSGIRRAGGGTRRGEILEGGIHAAP